MANKELRKTVRRSPVEVTFRVLGKRWTVEILREMFEGVTQFNRLQKHIGGITGRMLSIRLRELQELGLIKKVMSENPLRAQYELTEIGRPIEKLLIEGDLYTARRLQSQVFKETEPDNLSELIEAEPIPA
jgi:DNA-binding HxlR family transcriptional regulator